jgi:hypothetical protein
VRADARAVLVAGHSRGAKLAAAAAADDGRIAALGLLDPVDRTFENPGAPSAADALRRAFAAGAGPSGSAGRQPPDVLVVGAGRNGDCIPAASNYAAFAAAAASLPAAATAALVAPGAGHLQFLDGLSTLQAAACARPRGIDEAGLRAASAAALCAWGRAALAERCGSGGGDGGLRAQGWAPGSGAAAAWAARLGQRHGIELTEWAGTVKGIAAQ